MAKIFKNATEYFKVESKDKSKDIRTDFKGPLISYDREYFAHPLQKIFKSSQLTALEF